LGKTRNPLANDLFRCFGSHFDSAPVNRPHRLRTIVPRVPRGAWPLCSTISTSRSRLVRDRLWWTDRSRPRT